MFRLKEMPSVRAMDYIHLPAASYKSAQPVQTDLLGARAAIFRVTGGEHRLLILQRAETDSLPGCWELPGGGVEDDDESLKTALCREIKEETGLTAAWIVQEVGQGERWEKVKGGQTLHAMAVTFIVEAEEVEVWERGIGKEAKEADATRSGPTNDKGTSFDGISVKLSDAEHQDYMWVTEAQVRALQAGDRKLSMTRKMDKTIIKAFELQQQIAMAKQTI
ncbi:hypothetical protein CAC42_1679 [Sphaceloma murrayae]|uniref:Nudix hydrolase domain-containing protein n=1 Tax=Sphaceloma murrayae TaxID=2082308 RepID=A0A2K1QHM6_9PEZI|nr:hypothetical protein CAC42_1679 [Sphaceloma murrayae]